MERAYSLLTIKSVDAERRLIRGIATTPSPDRSGDIVEPLGARYAAELPLLLHHRQDTPVGIARLKPATAQGIEFEAEFPIIQDPGPVQTEVERAWTSVLHKLIRGVSIGFKPIRGAVEVLKTGGMRYLESEICELSLVTVPANQGATVAVVKALDQAASGQASTPPATGRPMKPRPTMGAKVTTAEHIQNLENKRAATVARMTEIMEAGAAAGETLEPEAATEHDGLAERVKSMDADLQRWRDHEKLQIKSAAPVSGAPNFSSLPALPRISVRPNVAPGSTFVRYTLAMLNAKGDSYRALEYAKQWKDSTPEVELMIKAAVAPGTTTDPTWAGALVQVTNLTNEFVELSRPATILGKIPGLTMVPFNVSVPVQTAGGTYKWVGQAKAKPVGKLAFTSATLGMAKAAGIIVLTEELVRSSSPSAEAIVRNDMIKGIAQFLDQQFTDPAVVEVPNVSPASITNAAGTAASLDDPGKDLGAIVTFFSGNNVPLAGLTVIMNQTNAFAMGYKRDALGQVIFPGVGANGGTANGVTIIASNAVGDKVIGLAPEYILVADDGGVTIDVSREATLQMNDAPVNPADPATTVWSSLWQDNLVGLRAERFINWKRALSSSVYYLTGAVYTL